MVQAMSTVEHQKNKRLNQGELKKVDLGDNKEEKRLELNYGGGRIDGVGLRAGIEFTFGERQSDERSDVQSSRKHGLNCSFD